MNTIQTALQAVNRRIAEAARDSGRVHSTIKLVAVSKSWPADKIREAYHAGQSVFGESYLQEALPKIGALSDLAIEWHFIGPIQSNKTGPIAEHFSWVHSVDREKIAERLSRARPAELPPLQVCLQVNIGGETTKGGVSPHALVPLARFVNTLPGLTLRGLMAIPRPTDDVAIQRRQFGTLRKHAEHLAGEGIVLDTLSMGMSDDLESAIAEGATLVRIGTALFGGRPRSADTAPDNRPTAKDSS